jgi:signal transduction histidine kinase
VGTSPAVLEAVRSHGVMGMRERARHFGGRLGIESARGRGTTVRLVMPLGATP